MDKKKICIIASVPNGIISFWKTNIDKISNKFDVYIVANFENKDIFNDLKIKDAKSIRIERHPSIFKELNTINELTHYFKQEKFNGFISMSSNASLVASIAGWKAKIPFRARIFTGQIWANKKGISRMFFKLIDRVTVLLNTHFLVDGKSQQNYLIQNGILKIKQSCVLANGSICGVDTERFKPNPEIREIERKNLHIEDSDIVFAFMGRINRDKGTFELLEAFNRLVGEEKHVKLLLIGNNEGIDNNIFNKYSNIRYGINLICYGFTKAPYNALQAGDVFCLPSYREGFGMSVIEAASLELPVIASDAYGLKDSFINGVTGLCCKMKNVESLYEAMKQLYKDNNLRKKMGKAGRDRIIKDFSMDMVSDAWLNYFSKNIK